MFVSDICATIGKMELAMNIPGFKSNTFLNHNIAKEEIRAIDKVKLTFACFVDFQRAFDWINRDLLTFKL